MPNAQDEQGDTSQVKLFKTKPEVYVSEPDLQAVLDHLRALPYSNADSTPRVWDRQRLIVALQEKACDGEFLKVDAAIPVGPGLLAVCKPLGSDLLRMPGQTAGLQVWLFIRSVGTDPTALTKL